MFGFSAQPKQSSRCQSKSERDAADLKPRPEAGHRYKLEVKTRVCVFTQAQTKVVDP